MHPHVHIYQGGVATALADLAMHPIDTIKTVQQAAPAVREDEARDAFAANSLNHITLTPNRACRCSAPAARS